MISYTLIIDYLLYETYNLCVVCTHTLCYHMHHAINVHGYVPKVG